MQLLCTIFAVGVAGCGSSSAHACVTAPQPFPSNPLLTSGTELTVPVGAIVYVVLVEPAAYSGPGFPWLTPTSSDPSVLARASLQADRRIISAADGDRLPRRPPRQGDAERAADAPVARAQSQDQASARPGLRHGEVTRAVGARLLAFRRRLTDGPAQSLAIHYR